MSTGLVEAAEMMANWRHPIARTDVGPDVDNKFDELQAAVLLGTNQRLLLHTSRAVLACEEIIRPFCSDVVWDAMSKNFAELREIVEGIS